ncbi:hypothetical protein ACVMGC_003686 [Bradyrhizobium barranii subsp. barranii]|uniref:Uncharacterized protein n=1 Tax=Bradyrhizobium barranii subsp. barranii TaxID=2823807 RepID=A0A939S9C5_9BRAD|nr:hypothetical protein [Bradyrhizobium barranii]UEM11931.1 hypothetical protein J4G43_047075 [Bradyrhizobium barranii subsp. barranii]
MPRIRTIKPEFPQSETIGKLSRDARLLFVQLWTLCDDEGRTRAASRMLASLLYPYDEDAPSLIDGWLDELEREGCVVRYVVEGSTYLQVNNWLKHQKIDRPTKSRLPVVSEGSRLLANTREDASTDLGPRTMDQDLGPRTNAAPVGAPRDARPGELDLGHAEAAKPQRPDPETELFRRGREVLGKSAGGVISQLLKAKGKPELARAAVEVAATKENPREYIGAIIRGNVEEDRPRGAIL